MRITVKSGRVRESEYMEIRYGVSRKEAQNLYERYILVWLLCSSWYDVEYRGKEEVRGIYMILSELVDYLIDSRVIGGLMSFHWRTLDLLLLYGGIFVDERVLGYLDSRMVDMNNRLKEKYGLNESLV